MKREKTRNFIHWLLGIVLCCLGVALCTKANFGLSMIAAPPYILHVALRDRLSWYTQGTSEYIWQAVLLLIVCLVIRRFRWRYLLSFLTAMFAGFVLDGWLWVLGGNGVYGTLYGRIAAFAVGAPLISLAIAFVFRTDWPIQVYELVVKEVADRFALNRDKVKLCNDIAMLVISVALSLILTHGFTGVGVGTVIVTFANAPLISVFGKLIDRVEKKLFQEK